MLAIIQEQKTAEKERLKQQQFENFRQKTQENAQKLLQEQKRK